MQNKNSEFWTDLGFRGVNFLTSAAIELKGGVEHSRIDIERYVFPGTAIACIFALRLDALGLYLFNIENFHLSYPARAVIVYSTLASGWLIWSFERAYYRSGFLSQLRAAFSYCELKSNRKYPSFISDVEIDEHVRTLKLFTQGIPLSKFTDNRENLEGHLNFTVVKMYEEVGDKSRINIIYAMKGLEPKAHIDPTVDYTNAKLPIGVGYEGPLHVNMRDVGHILVAGQTNGGKSNFLKVATSTLLENNNNAEVYFLDFKGGMELADLTNRLGTEHANFVRRDGIRACVNELISLGSQLESRFKDIASAGASNLDDYEKKYVASTEDESGIRRAYRHARRFVVIDEIAQLYSKDATIPKEDLIKARDAVNRIARQGRAAGVHLIVALQKPTSTNFDQTVKSNLPAVLCFPMVSQSDSVSALGTKRAFDLDPDIKGRAVWKFGPKLTEVQTYIFD